MADRGDDRCGGGQTLQFIQRLYDACKASQMEFDDVDTKTQSRPPIDEFLDVVAKYDSGRLGPETSASKMAELLRDTPAACSLSFANFLPKGLLAHVAPVDMDFSSQFIDFLSFNFPEETKKASEVLLAYRRQECRLGEVWASLCDIYCKQPKVLESFKYFFGEDFTSSVENSDPPPAKKRKIEGGVSLMVATVNFSAESRPFHGPVSTIVTEDGDERDMDLLSAAREIILKNSLLEREVPDDGVEMKQQIAESSDTAKDPKAAFEESYSIHQEPNDEGYPPCQSANSSILTDSAGPELSGLAESVATASTAATDLSTATADVSTVSESATAPPTDTTSAECPQRMEEEAEGHGASTESNPGASPVATEDPLEPPSEVAGDPSASNGAGEGRLGGSLTSTGVCRAAVSTEEKAAGKKADPTTQALRTAGLEQQLRLFERIYLELNDHSKFVDLVKLIHVYMTGAISVPEFLILAEDVFPLHVPQLAHRFKKYLLQRDGPRRKHSYFLVPLNQLDYAGCERVCKSYISLPSEFQKLWCSGRTRCPTVSCELNDQWVSLPHGSEYSSNFKHMRKNTHEEQLFRLEDEMYEFDMVIQNNDATVEALVPFEVEINAISEEERKDYTFPRSPFKVFHLKTISRIYGDHAAEILDLLRRCPGVTVPLVASRLREKAKEWREARAQMWKEQWLEIMNSNFFRAYDHRSQTLRQDEKALWNHQVIIVDALYAYASNSAIQFPRELIQIFGTSLHKERQMVDSAVQSKSDSLTTGLQPLEAPYLSVLTSVKSAVLEAVPLEDSSFSGAALVGSYKVPIIDDNGCRRSPSADETTDIPPHASDFSETSIPSAISDGSPEFRYFMPDQEVHTDTIEIILFACHKLCSPSTQSQAKYRSFISRFFRHLFLVGGESQCNKSAPTDSQKIEVVLSNASDDKISDSNENAKEDDESPEQEIQSIALSVKDEEEKTVEDACTVSEDVQVDLSIGGDISVGKTSGGGPLESPSEQSKDGDGVVTSPSETAEAQNEQTDEKPQPSAVGASSTSSDWSWSDMVWRDASRSLWSCPAAAFAEACAPIDTSDEFCASRNSGGDQEAPISKILFANAVTYCVIRYYRMIYERLAEAKRLINLRQSMTEIGDSFATESELGLGSRTNDTKALTYREYISTSVFQLLNLDTSVEAFDADTRASLGNFGFFMSNLPPLCRAIAKLVAFAVADPMTSQCLALFFAFNSGRETLTPSGVVEYRRIVHEVVESQGGVFRVEWSGSTWNCELKLELFVPKIEDQEMNIKSAGSRRTSNRDLTSAALANLQCPISPFLLVGMGPTAWRLKMQRGAAKDGSSREPTKSPTLRPSPSEPAVEDDPTRLSKRRRKPKDSNEISVIVKSVSGDTSRSLRSRRRGNET